MIDLLGWLMRTFAAGRRARCTDCGREAHGRVLYGPIDDSVPTAIVCEHCGKRWDIGVQMRSREDPLDA